MNAGELAAKLMEHPDASIYMSADEMGNGIPGEVWYDDTQNQFILYSE